MVAAVTCQRAGDQLSHCRQMLLARGEPSEVDSAMTPSCVHKDILERPPVQLLGEVTKLRQHHLAKTKLSKASKKADVIKKEGRAFIWAATRLTFEHAAAANRGAEDERITATCCTHNRQCPILPEAPPGVQAVCNNSGINCYDWSSMGSQQWWLGKSALPFVQ